MHTRSSPLCLYALCPCSLPDACLGDSKTITIRTNLQACRPSYSGGWGRRLTNTRQALATQWFQGQPERLVKSCFKIKSKNKFWTYTSVVQQFPSIHKTLVQKKLIFKSKEEGKKKRREERTGMHSVLIHSWQNGHIWQVPWMVTSQKRTGVLSFDRILCSYPQRGGMSSGKELASLLRTCKSDQLGWIWSKSSSLE